MHVSAVQEPSFDPVRRQPPRSTWPWRVLTLSIFALAVVIGLLGYQRIVGGLRSLLPSAEPQGRVLYWVSPHDPNFKSDEPGKDSMGMDLVPVYEGQTIEQQPAIVDPVLQESQVRTEIVERGPLVRTVQSIGTVAYAEPLIGDVTLKVNAWIEKLHVNYLGQSVRKEEPLFEIYSPEIVATEQEFLLTLQAAARPKSQPRLDTQQFDKRNLESVRQRLRNWDVTEQQIDELAETWRVQKTLTFYSPFKGIVIEKMAFEGRHMTAGSILYRIADLSKVWIYLYVYQNQIHCVYEGQGATMTLPNLPGHQFRGQVVYIYPYLEPKIRAVKVRLEFENADLLLKPGMFADVVLEPHRMGLGAKVSQQAILDTGARQLVYLALADGKYRARQVTTGMELDGGKIEVLSGLTEGERVVTSGQFLLDSESRLRLVNRKFEEPAAMPGEIDHGDRGGHVGAIPNGETSAAAGHEGHSEHQMRAKQMPDMGPPSAAKE